MKRYLIFLILALPLAAQNPVIRQGTSPTGAVDFSDAATTKPLRIGTTLPTSCTAGELFFLAGTGVFQCVDGVFTSTGSGGTWGSISGSLRPLPSRRLYKRGPADSSSSRLARLTPDTEPNFLISKTSGMMTVLSKHLFY